MRHTAAVALALVAVFSGTAFAAEPTKPNQPVVQEVELTKLVIDFPGARDREALVILEFDVLANGRTANITLVDDGFHDKRFVEEATRALTNSRWVPRRINGQPVDSTGLRKTFRFSLVDSPEQQPSISVEFATETRKVEELIQRGDLAEGEAHAQWVIAHVVRFRNEYALLQAELAQIYMRMGKTAEALDKIWLATSSAGGWPNFLQLLDSPPPNKPSNYMLNKELMVVLLGMRMRLMAARGLALEAMQTYYELAGLEPPAPDDPLVPIANMMTERIRDSDTLRGEIRIGQSLSWRQFLSRRRFSLENVRGSVSGMKLNCQANSQELNYQPGEEWAVPDDWGLCTVLMKGSIGTTFDFVEFADASNPSSTTF